MTHVLDHAPWAALTGAHAHLAERHGAAARYHPDVAPFATLSPGSGARGWADLAELVGPGVEVAVAGVDAAPPDGWTVVWSIDGVQMVGTALASAHDRDAVRLTAADVPDMLDLVARAEPGPFRERTIELGGYLGVHRDGALIAMAGERVRPPGWSEISAVCTDPGHRGQGHATRLIRAVAAGIRDRGEVPFLHAAASNTSAIRLYEALGFALRRKTRFYLLRTPA
ncbi:GNAT family N-acetyltransferase [Micromonospora sp. CPCC 205371]|nr:GNAT family N-acetyltransferase [Micromonospora sp. CPCC 205371]